MNYFELYELPLSFLADEKQIRAKYLELSKKYHPDFFSSATTDEQIEALELSTLNNKAFQTLSDFDKRMKYILKEKGYLEEEEKFTLPQMFLMEMMDLNEMLMEIQFDPDPQKKEQVLSKLGQYEKHLLGEILPALETFKSGTADDVFFHRVKEFYYKRRYLLRIREQLDKFAGS